MQDFFAFFIFFLANTQKVCIIRIEVILMNNLKDRRIELGLTMKQVADYVGVSEATVSRWESGNIANMKRSRIQALSEILKLSPVAICGIEDSHIANVIPLPKVINVPIIGTIACGNPIFAEENFDGYIAAPVSTNADFALRCKGDSMIDARILDGDIVFIRKQEDVENGEIAAVLLENEATLKRVYKQEGKLVLAPANPTYMPMVLTGEELENVRILGKAVSFISNVR